MSFLKSKKFRKARKFVYCFFVIFLVTFLTITPLTVSAAKTYDYNGISFYNNGILIINDNNTGQFVSVPSKEVSVQDPDSQEVSVTWELPAWTSPSNVNDTSVYFRFSGLDGVLVKPGEVLQIDFDFAFWGLLASNNFEFAISTRFHGWASTRDNRFGKVLRATRSHYTYKFFNNDKYAGKIQFIYFGILIKNPISWSSGTLIETLFSDVKFSIFKAGLEDKTYSDYDNSDVIKFEKNEADLIGSIDGDLDKTTTFFEGVTDLFNKDDTGNGWIKGAFVISDMFRLWYSVPWVKKLVDISLVLGAFALIFGVTVWAASSIGGRASRSALHRYNSKKGD